MTHKAESWEEKAGMGQILFDTYVACSGRQYHRYNKTAFSQSLSLETVSLDNDFFSKVG